MQELAEGIYLHPGAVNCGIISRGGDALVIDTGLDKEAGRKLLKALGEKSLKVIINTHAHADHFGGNDFLTKRTGAEVWASRAEGAGMDNPEFEPVFLAAGSAPLREMYSRFFLAPRSTPGRVLTGGERITDWDLEILDLPGHSIEQLGVACGEVCFTADAFLGTEALTKHGIPFNVDITAQLNTLDLLADLPYHWFVPAHGEAREREGMRRDVEQNRNRIELILELIAGHLAEGPLNLEQIVKWVCDSLDLTVGNPGQFYLFRTSINAYLTHLAAKGMVRPMFEANCFLWERV